MVRSLIRCVALSAVAILFATQRLRKARRRLSPASWPTQAAGSSPAPPWSLKNSATGTAYETVTNTAGAFSIPSIDPGTYTLTVSLSGFKTAVVNEVRLLASRPAEVKVTLEVGALTETRRGQGVDGTGADAVVDRHVDDHDRADQQPAARVAQRAVLHGVPARRRNARRPARLDDHGPAAEHDQHHDRRHQQQQQLPVGRRVLLAGHAAHSTRSRKSR